MVSPSPHLDRTLAALADPTRRQVIDVLRNGPRRASELAEISGVSRPLMSRHLRVLRASQLIEEERVDEDARLRIFHLRQQPFADLSDWLEEIQAFWNDQLAAFKMHLEKKSEEINS